MLDRVLESILLAILCAVLLLLSPLSANPAVSEFQLRDTAGVLHTSASWNGAKAILLFFVTNDCPVTNSYVPEMNRIQATYAARGLRTFAIQADTSVPAATVADYARDYRYAFPVLLDPHQVLVKLTRVTVTPEAVVLTPEGKVLYRGRIDNRVEDFGKQRSQATVHDVRDAVEAALAGRQVAQPFTKSIGCAITIVASGAEK
jgi:peroxiredoxin